MEPKGWWPWNFVCIIGYSGTTKFAQMMTLGWPGPILWQSQIWSLVLLYGKKVRQWIFQNYCRLWFESSNRWPKWQEVSVDIKTLSPGGCMPPAPGLYTCKISWKKKCIKSDFKEISLKLATNDRSDKMFCWHQNFIPKMLSAPVPGLYTCIKSWKKLYKIRFKEIFFKLVANDRSDKVSVPWCCLPLTCGCVRLLNHEKMCIKSEVEEILFKLATNDHSDEAFLLTSKFWP